MTVAAYLHTKHILDNTPGVIKNGQLFALYEGEEIPDKEFSEMFKVPDRLWSSRENPNKKFLNLI